MTHATNDTLYHRVIQKGLRPAHVAEVGVHQPESSNVYGFIRDGVRTTLVEPEPEAVEQIKRHFAEHDNVTLHECAIGDVEGQITLFKRGPSTFAGNLPNSPARVNDDYEPDPTDQCMVKAATFDNIDDGTIEVLSVDIEGSEWYVIERLVSRPVVISVETHGGAYVNPFLAKIGSWIKGQGYRTWYRGKTDSVYVRKGAFSVTLMERLQLHCMNAYIFLRRVRKRLATSTRDQQKE